MSYFLSNHPLQLHQPIEIDGDEAAHVLLSRRMKAGEQVVLQDTDQQRYVCELVEVRKKSLIAKPVKLIPVPPEPLVPVTLFLAAVSEKALDFIFQKATELGAAKIVLFNSHNTATRLTSDQFAKKSPRWQKICAEAAKQCDRGQAPALEHLNSFGEMITVLPSIDIVFVLDVSGGRMAHMDGQMAHKACTLVVGPEGGFTAEELQTFDRHLNCHKLKLSPFILRTETAAIAGLSAVTALL